MFWGFRALEFRVTSITELWGPNSIMVVYMDPLGQGLLKGLGLRLLKGLVFIRFRIYRVEG